MTISPSPPAPAPLIPALVIQGASRRFSGLIAVDDVSFAVPAGGATGLIGPNGAGKTTLFAMIAGEIRPSAGTILFHGLAIAGAPPHAIHALGLARTFQIPRPIRRLSVVENLLLGRRGQAGERLCAALLARRRVAREERAARARAREILHEIDLGAYENVAAGALSGGQHKLLELGRALMAAPRALLLDEPCAGVSPALLDVLSTVLDRLRRNGVTLLIVEHNVSFVRRHCEHLVVMERGRKLLEGEPGAVLHDRRVLDAFLEARVA